MGHNYALKFNLTDILPLPAYLNSPTFKDGSDICLTVGIVDTDAANFKQDAMDSLEVPDMVIPKIEPGKVFKGYGYGYPKDVYDKETLHMELNKEIAPYVSFGEMHYLECNDKDTASLRYGQ